MDELVDLPKMGLGISSRPRWTEIESGSKKAPDSYSCKYSGVWREAAVGFLYVFNSKDEQSTDTLDIAMAADPIQGWNKTF